jgi:hypothetical protein
MRDATVCCGSTKIKCPPFTIFHIVNSARRPQRRTKRAPATFCFIVNWNGSVEGFPAVETEFFAAIKGILSVIKRDLQ